MCSIYLFGSWELNFFVRQELQALLKGFRLSDAENIINFIFLIPESFCKVTVPERNTELQAK